MGCGVVDGSFGMMRMDGGRLLLGRECEWWRSCWIAHSCVLVDSLLKVFEIVVRLLREMIVEIEGWVVVRWGRRGQTHPCTQGGICV